MKHTGKVTGIDKMLCPELRRQCCADVSARPCPCYHAGDEAIVRAVEHAKGAYGIPSAAELRAA